MRERNISTYGMSYNVNAKDTHTNRNAVNCSFTLDGSVIVDKF